MLHVAVNRSSSDGSAMRNVYFRFLKDVIFSHNGANGPELKTTHVSSSSPVTVPVGRQAT